MGVAPALAGGTAGVEPASGAERATAAMPEASVPGAYGKGGRRREAPPQGKAGREVEAPPRKGNRGHEPPPEALPQKGERKPEALSRKGRRGQVPLRKQKGELDASLRGSPSEGECRGRTRGAAIE